MNKKIIYILTVVGICGFVLLLYPLFAGRQNPKGFSRTLKPRKLIIDKTYELPHSKFYFSGLKDNTIYFHSIKNNGSLYGIDFALSKLWEKDLGLKPDSALMLYNTSMNVTDSIVYLTQSKTGFSTAVNLKSRKVRKYKSPEISLMHARLISGQSIIGKSAILVGQQLQRTLVKVNFKTGVVENIYPLEKQVDGFLCTDGMIHYDKENARILYVYSYRGQFLCLDTNLNLLFKSKTIDTVKKAVIDVARTMTDVKGKKGMSITTRKPPGVVNRNFIVFEDNLYTMAAIRADNENQSDFDKNQVVDVYSTNLGKYLYSFYIPKFYGQKPREFRITKDFVFATFSSSLVRYAVSE